MRTFSELKAFFEAQRTPPPPPKPVERKVLPPIRARLLATMIEAENSTAVLRLATGEVVFRKVGQPLGNGESNATA